MIEVGNVLNARVVAVLNQGVFVPIRDTIDGAGGPATEAAAALLGNKEAHSLPDSATVPATDRHPEVVLHYANGDVSSNQARRSQGEDVFYLDVPPAHYQAFHLFSTSGWGASQIEVKLFTQASRWNAEPWKYRIGFGN